MPGASVLAARARLYGKALQCFADAHVCVVGIGGGLMGGGSAGENRNWRDYP